MIFLEKSKPLSCFVTKQQLADFVIITIGFNSTWCLHEDLYCLNSISTVIYLWNIFGVCLFKNSIFFLPKKISGSEHFTWVVVAEGTWGKIPTMWTYFITVEDLNFVLFISQKCMHVCVGGGGGQLAGENNLDLLLTQWQIF